MSSGSHLNHFRVQLPLVSLAAAVSLLHLCITAVGKLTLSHYRHKPHAMLDLYLHTATDSMAPESSQLPVGVQLIDTVQHKAIPVLNIPPPSPVCPRSGDPLLPWWVWFVVFSSYLYLPEEDQGNRGQILSGTPSYSVYYGRGVISHWPGVPFVAH